MCVDLLSGEITHTMFEKLTGLLRKDDILVMNNTRVRKARLFGKKESGAAIELLIDEVSRDGTIRFLAKPAKRIQNVTRIKITGDVCIDVSGRTDRFFSGHFVNHNTAILSADEADVLIERYGHMPLPPYITEKCGDENRYQTVYSSVTGSAAAPTAGLHFDHPLLDALKLHGIQISMLSLEINSGTFLPVSHKDIRDHRMHQEKYSISADTAVLLNTARKENRRIIAVGTTSLRALEDNIRNNGNFSAGEFTTDIFLHPPQRIISVDGLITNFHLPVSTLIMLVCAFGGYELIMRSYIHAVENRYRFYSFGDAQFIFR